jgi:hypothetical protein
MAIPFDIKPPAPTAADGPPPVSAGPLSAAGGDPRAVRILAKTIYRDLRQAGLAEEDVMCLAGELLSLVAGDMHERRKPGQP